MVINVFAQIRPTRHRYGHFSQVDRRRETSRTTMENCDFRFRQVLLKLVTAHEGNIDYSIAVKLCVPVLDIDGLWQLIGDMSDRLQQAMELATRVSDCNESTQNKGPPQMPFGKYFFCLGQ